MRVLLDTQILVYWNRRGPVSNVEEYETLRRAWYLFYELDKAKARIIVPTIVIGEFLVGCRPETHQDVVREFTQKFDCPAFDLVAAMRAAEIRQSIKDQSIQKLYSTEENGRNILSADIKILACGLADRMTHFYSNDKKFQKLANLFVNEAHALPTKGMDLFADQLVEERIGKCPQKNSPPTSPEKKPGERKKRRD